MIRIFCDADTVLVWFCKGAIELHHNLGNCELDYVPSKWNFYEDWGLTTEEFWKPIDSHPYFWHNLEPLPHFNKLIDLIKDYDCNFKVLTIPRDSENCYAGKFQWVKSLLKFPVVNERLILHADKSALVKDEDCVLIDDHEVNCDQWVAAGGKAILFPDSSNSNRDIEDKVGYVKSELVKYYGEM